MIPPNRPDPWLPPSRRLPARGAAGPRPVCVAPIPRPDVACPAYGKLQPAVPADAARPSRRDELIAAYRSLHARDGRPAPRRRGRLLARAPLAIAAALLCQASAALPPIPDLDVTRERGFLYELELGGYYSDNRGLTNPKSDAGLVLLPSLDFLYFRHGGRIETQARGRFDYYQWLEKPGRNDLRARLTLGMDAGIVPGLLHWTLVDQADVRPDGFFVPGLSGDLRQVNVVSTGPSLRLRPHGIWSAQAEAHYALTYAERLSEFNSNRVLASTWLRYAPHPRRHLSLGAEFSDVDFDREGPLNPDYDRVDLMARYQSSFRLLDFELVGGSTKIRFDDGEELSGPLTRASVRYQMHENHQLRLAYSREFSDTARDMLLEGARFDRPRTPGGRPPLRPSQRRGETADATWNGRFRHTTWGLTVYGRDYDYPFELASDPLSHRGHGASLAARYDLNSRQSLRLETLYEQRRFKADDRLDRDRYVAVHFDQRLNERWSLRTGVSHFKPDADERGVRWTENMVSVSLVRHGGLQ
jgi:hypothetical protein